MKFALIVLGFAAFLVLIVGLSIYVPRWTAGPVGLTEEIVITNKGAYRIQGYERFYDFVEQVEAVDVKLASYRQDLATREAVECRGLLARRADIVQQYNADAQKVRTVGKWRADNLPSRLYHNLTRTC